MSKYEETIKALATESDDEKRLEMAAAFNSQLDELDERFDNRETINNLQSQLDRTERERDEIKTKYVERFFDAGEGSKTGEEIKSRHQSEVKEESKSKGYAALWEER